MKAVIYARYSSDNQTENSIEGQLRECNEFAAKNGITVLKNYIDRAYSAKTDNRPDFQKMIEDSHKKLFDVIICWKWDRFARNMYDCAYYEHILDKNGVKVLTTEPISDSPEGQLTKRMLQGFAEYFSAELAVKVNRGMKENAYNCKFNGGSVTFGYKIDENQHFQVDLVSAPVVREVFNDYATGKTIQKIANELNERGISQRRQNEC